MCRMLLYCLKSVLSSKGVRLKKILLNTNESTVSVCFYIFYHCGYIKCIPYFHYNLYNEQNNLHDRMWFDEDLGPLKQMPIFSVLFRLLSLRSKRKIGRKHVDTIIIVFIRLGYVSVGDLHRFYSLILLSAIRTMKPLILLECIHCWTVS